MNLFLKFWRLRFTEKAIFFKCIFLLNYYRIRLKTTPLQTLLAEIEQESLEVSKQKQHYGIMPQTLISIIRGASRFAPFTTCLSQTITGRSLFAKNGNHTQIHIGIHKDISVNFAAHAWLSMDGKVLLGLRSDLHQYKEFTELTLFTSKNK